LESLVALLRNHTTASNVDVELYFQDFTKLTLKFQRIDPTKLDAEIVAKHQQDLKKILPSFQNDAKLRNYSPYIEWGIAFCDYAQKVLKVTDV
jgi:hypothetical protein